jgi:ankyrin repeat protein
LEITACSLRLADRRDATENAIVMATLQAIIQDRDFDAAKRAIARGGVDVNALDETGCTPLHAAVNLEAGEVIEWLLSAGADPNRSGAGHDAPLHDAVMGRRDDLVQILLCKGAAPNLPTSAARRRCTWPA